MKLRILGCSGGSVKGRFLSCFLVNDTIALDAGGLTGPLTLEEQYLVRHVIVSHTHLDHNCGLPFFLDNVFGNIEEPITVYGIESVFKVFAATCSTTSFGRTSRSFRPRRARRSASKRSPRMHRLRSGHCDLLPFRWNHLTPTVGLLVDDGDSAIIYTSDTGPTETIWRIASAQERLKAIITEVSFSDDEPTLAHLSGHMTPSILAGELKKLSRDVPILITHTKPAHVDRIQAELARLKLPNVQLIEQGKTYTF